MQVLVNEVDHEHKLLEIRLILNREQVRIFAENLAQNGVIMRALDVEGQLVRYTDEGLSMSDRLDCTHAHKAALEVGWVLDFGHFYSVFTTPVFEHSANPPMLGPPIGAGIARSIGRMSGFSLLSFSSVCSSFDTT